MDDEGVDDVHDDHEVRDQFSRYSRDELPDNDAKERMVAAAIHKRELIPVEYSEQEGNLEGMMEDSEIHERLYLST